MYCLCWKDSSFAFILNILVPDTSWKTFSICCGFTKVHSFGFRVPGCQSFHNLVSSILRICRSELAKSPEGPEIGVITILGRFALVLFFRRERFLSIHENERSLFSESPDVDWVEPILRVTGASLAQSTSNSNKTESGAHLKLFAINPFTDALNLSGKAV